MYCENLTATIISAVLTTGVSVCMWYLCMFVLLLSVDLGAGVASATSSVVIHHTDVVFPSPLETEFYLPNIITISVK